MKDPISITIPFEYHALTRASDFLHGLAQDAKVAGMRDNGPDYGDGPEFKGYEDRVTEQGPTASTTGVDDQHAPDPDHVPDEDYPAERDPSAAFGNGASPSAPNATAAENTPAAAAGTAGTATGAADREASATNGSTSAGPADSAATGQAAAGTDQLDLDADGLPWDGRIHSSSKKKLAKTKQWKKRRKPNDQAEDQWERYVESVEAELRRVMQAGPHAPVEAKQPEPEPAAPAGPTPPLAGPTPPPAGPTGPQSVAAAEIKTLPELFRLITGNNISDDKVMAAINAQGIDSLPLLGARPDLIPAVAKALQEG